MPLAGKPFVDPPIAMMLMPVTVASAVAVPAPSVGRMLGVMMLALAAPPALGLVAAPCRVNRGVSVALVPAAGMAIVEGAAPGAVTDGAAAPAPPNKMAPVDDGVVVAAPGPRRAVTKKPPVGKIGGVPFVP